jgi:hypothetical protein
VKWEKTQNTKKWLKERLIGCWYGYYKTYHWMRKIYKINLWIAGGIIGVVQQQQQGSTSRASIASRWSAPILSSLILWFNKLLMWDVNYRMLDIRRKEKSLRNDADIWIVFLMYVYSRWTVVLWIAKWWNYSW